MKALWLSPSALWVFFTVPAVASSQPLFSSTESIDSSVTNSAVVVVGNLATVGNGIDRDIGTLAVEQTLKGEHHQRLQVRFNYPTEVVAGWKERSAQLLVMARGEKPTVTRVIELSANRLEVMAADFAVIRKPEEVIGAAIEAVRRMPAVKQIETFRLVVPGKAATDTQWHKYYETGGYLTLDVPVDERLEKRALECIRSAKYTEREVGARALRCFKSEENIGRVKLLLTDPGRAYLKHAEENMGVEVRFYGVRAAAYQTLRYWGVRVDEPVTREEASKPELVRLVDLSNTRVTEADLGRLTRFKNLQELYLRNVPVSNGMLKRLKEFKRLRSLELGATGVTNEGLKEIAGLSELRHLSLRGTKVTGASLKDLVGLKNLSTLDLSQTGVTDEGLKHLSELSGLRNLDVSGTEISAGGVRALVTILPDLKVTR
jgi:hypothetical protein